METRGRVEAAGAELAYREEGEGRALVVVHDLGFDRGASDLAALGGRAVSYARRGYGGSTAPEGYVATTVEEQAADLAALVRGLALAPAVLLGEGFGALIALDVAKREPALVRSLVLVDAPLFAFVPAATQVMAEQRSALEVALRAGGRDAAVAAYLGDRADAGELARAQAYDRAFFADYAGLSSWPVTRRDLRAIRVPAVILTRPGAAPHVLAASDALAELLPEARRVLDGDVLEVFA